jgi:hypothetical protein
MNAKQFTLRLKYQVGELAEVTRILAYEGVNILGIFAREVEEFALVRLTVDDPVKAERLFKENGIDYEPTPGLLVLMKHEPGALHQVTETLATEGVGIIYLYIVLLPDGETGIVFRVDDMEEGLEVLREAELNVHLI